MMKIESHIPTIVCAALVLVAHASQAQVGSARSGTYIDRRGDNSAEISKSSQIIQTNKAANEAEDRREQSRVNSLRANQKREAQKKENQKKAANLELEKQMEKTRQETYQYYRDLSDSYHQRAKIRNREKRGKPDAAAVEKKPVRPDKDLPECGIKPVMTDAEIEALRLCR